MPLLSSICLPSIKLISSTLKSALLRSCSLKFALLSRCRHSWQTQLACWAHSAVRWRNSNSSPSLCCSLSLYHSFSLCFSLPDDFAAVSLICFSAARRFPFLPHCSVPSLCVCVCVCTFAYTCIAVYTKSVVVVFWRFYGRCKSAQLRCRSWRRCRGQYLDFPTRFSQSTRPPKHTYIHTYICMIVCNLP